MDKNIIISDSNKKSLKIKKFLLKNLKKKLSLNSKLVIVIGGDGFMLKTLKKNEHSSKLFYGINSGSYGFLMNKFSPKNTIRNLSKAKMITISPLEMKVKNKYGLIKKSIAINEVSILRQSRQAASLLIKNGKKIVIKKLISDGVLISTPAGSTAYNLSVHGPILSLNSKKLSISPISAFRPRRWKGALIDENDSIEFKVIYSRERPASVTADNIEFRNIKSVKVYSSEEKSCEVLYDSNHSMEDKILNEQFDF